MKQQRQQLNREPISTIKSGLLQIMATLITRTGREIDHEPKPMPAIMLVPCPVALERANIHAEAFL